MMKPNLRKRLERYKTIVVEFPEEDLAFKLKRMSPIAGLKLIRRAEREAKERVKEGSISPEDANYYMSAVLLADLILEPRLTTEEVLELPGEIFLGLLERINEEVG